MSLENIFVEQAEYIATDQFKEWSTEHPDEEQIIKKLSQGGAKLITGPRGCGKTTLMLKTYHKLCSGNTKGSFPIYVNFKSSLKIEPLYKANANAVYWFNQWILYKVYQGLYITLQDLGITAPNGLKFSKEVVGNIINNIEYRHTEIGQNDAELTLNILEEEIQKVLQALNKTHCVLLLDDAAHAFSPEQQRDFFEFFRQIKSRFISPKAAVYPGVTIYSSTFHVGHDAEEIDVWIKPDSYNYIEFMMGLLGRRLPQDVFKELLRKKELLEVVCYGAFGMPRALLNMVRTFYKDIEDDDNESYNVSFTKKNVFKAIRESNKQTMGIYTSLRVKLPTYEKFINVGETTFSKMVNLVKDYNKGRESHLQSVTIAISKPIPAELNKVLGFFQYGGLLLPKGELNKGDDGVYELYSIHYAALIERNAFMTQKNIPIIDLVNSLSKRSSQAYKRVSPSVLLGTENISSIFELSLPPCHNCHTPRNSEHSKFCHECGAKLKTYSIFEALVSNDISELPLTQKRVERIKEHSNIRKIKDILMDIDNRELRKVPQVGSVWAQRIYSYAEEYIV
ncbi:hypothetical protein [Brevibacillus brevis]|uniref:hypothetical protein n=1 Tax=Brevibacillus brevis TaxID=1393 RepID=UPI0037CC2F6B